MPTCGYLSLPSLNFASNLAKSLHCLPIFDFLQKQEIDESGYTGIVLMDLSKAYDCLRHALIIAKFEAYGFDNISLKLFHSHFSNRTHRVKIGSATSKWNRYFNSETPRFYSWSSHI